MSAHVHSFGPRGRARCSCGTYPDGTDQDFDDVLERLDRWIARRCYADLFEFSYGTADGVKVTIRIERAKGRR